MPLFFILSVYFIPGCSETCHCSSKPEASPVSQTVLAYQSQDSCSLLPRCTTYANICLALRGRLSTHISPSFSSFPFFPLFYHWHWTHPVSQSLLYVYLLFILYIGKKYCLCIVQISLLNPAYMWPSKNVIVNHTPFCLSNFYWSYGLVGHGIFLFSVWFSLQSLQERPSSSAMSPHIRNVAATLWICYLHKCCRSVSCQFSKWLTGVSLRLSRVTARQIGNHIWRSSIVKSNVILFGMDIENISHYTAVSVSLWNKWC